MKKYKNVYLSLCSYVFAFVWYFFFLFQSISWSSFDINKLNMLLFIPWWFFTILGVFFSFRSVKLDESKKFGITLIVAELLVMFICILWYALANAIKG